MGNTRLWVNYLYFGILFALVALLSIGSLFLRDVHGPYLLFYLLTSVGQAFLEVSLLLFGGGLVRLFLPKFCFPLYIAFTFFILILHICDFSMQMVLDLTVWDALTRFVLDESFDNFIHLLDASGVPLPMWIVIFASVALLPFAGILVYRFTDLISRSKPLSIRADLFLQMLFLLPISLFLWDFSAARIVQSEAHDVLHKSLPWKVSFIHPRYLYLSLPSPLAPRPTEEDTLRQVALVTPQDKARPNIYLIIAESLREDFITTEIAPHLAAFRDANTSFPFAYSNANASHLSWFSIFHSRLPQYWKCDSKWSSGSPALQALKRLGYKVRLYTSAQLAYYGMEELIFGKENHLLDSAYIHHHNNTVEAWESDAATVKHALHDLEDPALQTGQLFIFFWDATHFDYSWPRNGPPKFSPIAEQMNYFLAYHSPQKVDLIRNRYKNALNYTDSLFGSFLAQIPRLDEAMIAFLGDHGEEFFEHGHLFHLSHLNEQQTHIPFYLKLPHKPFVKPQVASQIDLFPTLLDSLGINTPFLAGESLLSPTHRDVALTARFNAKRTPYEFALENGRAKLIAQFSNPHDIFTSPYLRIIGLHSASDERLNIPRGEIEAYLRTEFSAAFDRHFNSNR